jgi:hypothetical protein
VSRPRPVRPDDFDTWFEQNPRSATFSGPGEVEAGIEPAEALITDGDSFGQVVRVPWELNEIDLARLANGGTLWLSTWGGLPVHNLEVLP